MGYRVYTNAVPQTSPEKSIPLGQLEVLQIDRPLAVPKKFRSIMLQFIMVLSWFLIAVEFYVRFHNVNMNPMKTALYTNKWYAP